MTSLAFLGRPALVAALAFTLVAGGAFAVGWRRGRGDLVEVGQRAFAAGAVFVGLAAGSLLSALLSNDFSVEYAAKYTSASLEPGYRLTALWAGMEGSLLFWALLLVSFSTIALARARARTPELLACAGLVLCGVAGFFLTLLVAPANPFATLSPAPADGSGLNPLLQSPGMAIHPPLLYTGFVGFSIPFAFAMSALLTKRLDDSWFTSTRRWTLFAWSALSVGIVLGGAWAYTELGWGGYWAWDPVENASFMPWLTATAFVHSVVIQERRRMLKIWNVVLILMTYVLAVFGTFLTRSGILSSIHTFSEGPVGRWFLPFLGAMLIGGLAIVVARANSLRSENTLDSFVSREAAFLANNVLFVAAAFTVLWGTLYPIIAEAATGVRVAVGPPFFNSVFVPLGLAILALTGIGPLISWRRMRSDSLARLVRIPLLVGALVIAALAISGVRSVGALLAFGLCAFTSVAIGSEFQRGSRMHRTRHAVGWGRALMYTVARNRRRYGGYVVHLGVVLIVLGLAGSAFRSERQALLGLGDDMRVGAYTLHYDSVDRANTDEKQVFATNLQVLRGGSIVGTLRPQRNFHLAQAQWQSEVAIRTNPVEDLYAVVTSVDSDGTAAIRAFVNPLTWWIWAGAAVMLGGIAVLLTGDRPRDAPAPVPARRTQPAVSV